MGRILDNYVIFSTFVTHNLDDRLILQIVGGKQNGNFIFWHLDSEEQG